MIWLLALTSFRCRTAGNEREGCSRERCRFNGIESVDRCTHPVPNNLSKPSISFEVTLESNSLSHNNRRQGLYGNCQISWKRGWKSFITIKTLTASPRYTFSCFVSFLLCSGKCLTTTKPAWITSPWLIFRRLRFTESTFCFRIMLWFILMQALSYIGVK